MFRDKQSREAIGRTMTGTSTFRIVIAGGGTGGHIIPALAVARVLRDTYAADLLFIGTSRGLESRLVPQAGFKLELVEIGALNQVSLATRLKTMLNLPRAIVAAGKILREFNADAVLGVGGYASGPAMIAAILQQRPTMVFEPNLKPGLANRMIAGFVDAAAVHFTETKASFRNAQVTGVPVRKEFFQLHPKVDGPEKTLLITGGSQGAHAINEAMCKAASSLHEQVPNLAIIHQTGQKDLEDVRMAYAETSVEAIVVPFLDDMANAYAQADVVLCRSGASTCAELAASGRVAVFVPFPRAADDHQSRNAQAFVDHGAGVMVRQSELTAEKLAAMLAGLLNDGERRKKMSALTRQLAHSGAAESIAKMVVGLVKP